MKKLLVSLGIVLVCLMAINSVQGASYDHEMEGAGVTFSWKVDGDTLHGKLSAKTKGWVAVGFNPVEKMQGGNYILGYVKGNDVEVADHFGNKKINHDLDEKLGGTSDVTMVSGSEKGGTTTIEFTIPLNSGDEYDTVLVPDGETTVVLAHGPPRDSFKARHRNQAIKTVNLSTGAVK
jgi:hypothetical protein